MAAVTVLMIFPILENWIDGLRHAHSYTVSCALDPDVYTELERLIAASGMKVHSRKRTKRGDKLVCAWYAVGKPKAHESLVTQLLAHPAVEELEL